MNSSGSVSFSPYTRARKANVCTFKEIAALKLKHTRECGFCVQKHNPKRSAGKKTGFCDGGAQGRLRRMMVVGVWRVGALRERVVDRCGRFENFGCVPRVRSSSGRIKFSLRSKFKVSTP